MTTEGSPTNENMETDHESILENDEKAQSVKDNHIPNRELSLKFNEAFSKPWEEQSDEQ